MELGPNKFHFFTRIWINSTNYNNVRLILMTLKKTDKMNKEEVRHQDFKVMLKNYIINLIFKIVRFIIFVSLAYAFNS